MSNSLLKMKSNISLLLTALIWGATFAAQKSAMDIMPPFVFNGIRCILGAFSLFIISLFIKKSQKLKKRNLIEGGFIAGVLLFIATGLQQLGIVNSTAGHAGFISSLYIVMVPVFMFFSGKKIEKFIWVGVTLALSGLYLLCVQEGFAVQKGDLTILFSAVFFAIHIICIAKYARKTNPVRLSCLQFFFAGFFSLILGLIFESFKIQDIESCALQIFISGVLSCAVAFTLQISAQKYVNPYIASLILSLESVFAVFSGCLFLNESLTAREIIGCIIMFCAIFAASRHNKTKNNTVYKY